MSSRDGYIPLVPFDDDNDGSKGNAVHGSSPSSHSNGASPSAHQPASIPLSERSTPGDSSYPWSRFLLGPHNAASEDGLDHVHFAMGRWYVHESDGTALIKVMRVGDLKGSCSVKYRTIDGSAEAGDRYIATEGCLEFMQGEVLKEFSVSVIATDAFDTALSFMVALEQPMRCKVESRLSRAQVYILDDDVFPTDTYEKIIRSGNKEDLDAVSIHLLGEFSKYAFFHIPSIGWKTSVALLLEQFSNAYYLASIFMRIYLVDIVLNIKDDSTQAMLIFKGSRALNAVMVALAWFSPHILILAIDVFVTNVLDLGFTIRRYLRVNYFRKMLNYSKSSRQKVPVQEMIDTLVMTIPLITKHGYLGLFEVVKDLGKILVVVIFMFVKYPLCSTCASILFPTAMLCSFMCRQATSLRLRDQACQAELDSEALATDAARGLTIIDNFGMKDYTVTRYQECLKGQRSLTMEVKMFNFWSDQTVPWLSSIAITVYMIYGSFQVLEGAETVGSFVATLNVLKDLGDRFKGVYAGLAGARDTVKPLLTLVRFMNLPTDLPDKKLISDSCLTFATEKFQSSAVHNWDQVPILFSGVCFEHLPRCRNVDFSFSSGGIVLVHGPQGTGKKHVLKAFACGEKLRHGDVLMAPYQVTCFVDFDPVLLSWMSLLDNLRFGATEENGHPERIRQIFKRVGIQPDHWLMAHLERDIAGENEGWNKEESPWFIRASRCERKMIHMARAFVFDPHILVMHNVIDDLDKDHSSSILDMLTDFVNEGHVSMLMRTVVLSTGSSDIAEALWGWSDYQLDLRSIPLRITSASTSNGVRTHAHRHVSLLKYPYGALAECPRKAASDPTQFLI